MTDVDFCQWQAAIQHDEAAISRFMFYDRSSSSVLITDLGPCHERECARKALELAFQNLPAEYQFAPSQGVRAIDAPKSAELGITADEAFCPEQLLSSSQNQVSVSIGPQVPRTESIGNLVVEIRRWKASPFLEEKLDNWLSVGPSRLVLVVILRRMPATSDHPVLWRMKAILWDRQGWKKRRPLQSIEFGQAGDRRRPLPEPCRASGTHYLHIPKKELFWGVEVANQPSSLPDFIPIDLYELQQHIMG